MGTLWNRSGMVERYADDLRASGAKAFFFQGGTTTPLTVYQDSGEAAAHPNPVVADANGRWPDVFVPYIVSFDVRVTSADGVQLTFSLRIPNPNPVDTTVVVPVESQVQTGMIHAEMVNTVKSGYVRLNGRTIGNASSTGSERANADTQALFTYLWNNLADLVAPVSGGRGVSAAADFGANKTITLPTWRGCTAAGLDDMGNAPASAFAGLTFNIGGATTPGSAIGANSQTLTLAQAPAHTHAITSVSTTAAHSHTGSGGGTTSVESADHTHTYSGTTSGQSADHTHLYGVDSGGLTGGGAGLFGVGAPQHPTSGSSGDHSHTFSGTTSGISVNHTHTFSYSFTTSVEPGHTHTVAMDSQGGGQPFNNLPFTRLVTWFIKL